MKMVEFTYSELLSIRDSLNKNVKELKGEVSLLEDAIIQLNKILGKRQGAEIIALPEEILNLSSNKSNRKVRLEWKKIVYDTIRKSDNFLSTKMIFAKIRVSRPFQLNDERYSIKCISSSLVNLCSEGKVGKIKSESGVYFFGDTMKHFKGNGQPDLSFLAEIELR